MLRLRGKPLGLFLTDGSAIVTAWLIALDLSAAGAVVADRRRHLFAIVVAKHLYGGLGQNPVQSGDGRLCRLHRLVPGADVAVAGARAQAELRRAVRDHLPGWRRASTRSPARRRSMR
jgi:hypothetical protein